MFAEISASTLKVWLSDGSEIALLDVREAGQYGMGHPFFAAPLPYSRFEIGLTALVPTFEEGVPLALEFVSIRIELRKGMAHERDGRASQKGEGRGIRVEAYSAIVENQDAVESVLVNGSEFALRSTDALPPHIPSTNMQKGGTAEGY